MVELNITKIKDRNVNGVEMSDSEHFLWIHRGKDLLCLFFNDAAPKEINIDYWGESDITTNKI